MNGGANSTQQWQQIEANNIKCKCNKFLVSSERWRRHSRSWFSVYANFSFFKRKFNFTLNELSLNIARRSFRKSFRNQRCWLAGWLDGENCLHLFCGGESDIRFVVGFAGKHERFFLAHLFFIFRRNSENEKYVFLAARFHFSFGFNFICCRLRKNCLVYEKKHISVGGWLPGWLIGWVGWLDVFRIKTEQIKTEQNRENSTKSEKFEAIYFAIGNR